MPTDVNPSNTDMLTPSSVLHRSQNSNISGGTFISVGRDQHTHNYPPNSEYAPSEKDDALERAVNALRIDLKRVELTPNFGADIAWEQLPPGFKIDFSKPVVVKYNDDHVLNAAVGEIASESKKRFVSLSLPDDETGQKRFRSFASDILAQKVITLKLEGEFQGVPHGKKYNLNQEISFDGMNSLHKAIILDNVEIRKRVDSGGLLGFVKATINNFTCIDMQKVTLLSTDILYQSIKIGHHDNQIFELLHGVNTSIFRWIFTPPPTQDRDDEFRRFISQFLTSNNDIPVLLDLKTIMIEIGNHQVVLDGIKVDTTVKGLGQPLISRVDVYLGTNALRREVYFRFKLVNPIHAPIEVMDSVVDARFNGQLISHIEYCFSDLTVPGIGKDKQSEMVTAKLKKSLLKTILLVRVRTKIKLDIHIKSTTISIDRHPIPHLEFKLEGVECRIHFGHPRSLPTRELDGKPVITEKALLN